MLLFIVGASIIMKELYHIIIIYLHYLFFIRIVQYLDFLYLYILLKSMFSLLILVLVVSLPTTSESCSFSISAHFSLNHSSFVWNYYSFIFLVFLSLGWFLLLLALMFPLRCSALSSWLVLKFHICFSLQINMFATGVAMEIVVV